MEAYDVELGPIQRTFDELFRSISEYFQSAPVKPKGSVIETDLSDYSRGQLRNSLNSSLEYYGFSVLPSSIRIIISEESELSGIHRSDNITTYTEKISKGSFRTFNFYNKYGPEKLKVSYYWLDNANGEETRGLLTVDDRWYLRVATKKEVVYYIRIEREKPQ